MKRQTRAWFSTCFIVKMYLTAELSLYLQPIPVFLLFLHFLHYAYGMDIKIWMMAGTSKSPKIIHNVPIHSVLETNLPTRRMAQNLLTFHSITGCDTTVRPSSMGFWRKRRIRFMSKMPIFLKELEKQN